MTKRRDRESAMKLLDELQLRQVANADRALAKFKEAVDRLPSLLASDSHSAVPDGFPSGGEGGPRGSDISRPTENAVLSRFRVVDPETGRMEQREPVDLVHRWIGEVSTEMDEIAGHVSAVTSKLRQLDGYVTGKAAKSGGTCQACLRWVEMTPSDRIRSGYCPACFMAFVRAGRPDRYAFELSRRQAS